MKPTLWARTSTGTVTIADLGLVLNTTERNLTEEWGYSRLADSSDLVDAITSIEFSLEGSPSWSTLTDQEVEDILSSFTKLDHETTFGNVHQVNANDIGADNIVDEINTNATQTIDAINLDPELITSTGLTSAIATHAASGDHDTRYYTKTQLQTSGQSLIHWDNLTNKPAFGGGTYEPVIARALEVGAASAPAGTEGDYYVDDQATPHYWKYTTSWQDQGAVSTGDRFIDLNDANEAIKEWNGSSWDSTTPTDTWQVGVKDDGDGKAAIYVYGSGTWIKLADVDWGSPSLDDVYNNSPAGKSIVVDDGPVDLNQTSSYTPVTFNEVSAKPTNNPAAGKTGFTYIDGVLYMWDPDRSKWLSVERKTISFGADAKNTKDRFLDYLAVMPSLKSAQRLPRNATLVEIIFDSDAVANAVYRVRTKAASGVDLDTLTISGAASGQKINGNVDFSAADVPIVYQDVTSGNVDYPSVQLVFAYRLA